MLLPPGNTILHLAAQSQHTTCVEWIVQTYEELMKIRNKKKETPLKLAAVGGSLDTVKSLVRYAVKLCKGNEDGKNKSNEHFCICTMNDDSFTTLNQKFLR